MVRGFPWTGSQNRQKIVKRVLKDVKDGDMVLMQRYFLLPTSVEAALEIT